MSDIFRDYSFGGWLRHWRVEKKIGLREMAKSLGVDASNYCNIERSRLAPPRTELNIRKLVAPLELDESRIEMLISLSIQHQIGMVHQKMKEGVE